MPWVALAMAAAGAVAGSMKDNATESASGTKTTNLNLRNFDDINKGQSELEQNAYGTQLGSFQDLSRLMQHGPGTGEIDANNQFQNQYANQMQQFMNQIANPNQQQQFNTAKQYFAPQQTALNQQFADQNTQQNRLAAKLGRGGNDPTMRNMMMKEQTRQQTMLNSEIGAFGQQLPSYQASQLMSVGNNLSNLRQGLATQAMNNRTNLINMGNQLKDSERNYRLQTAQRSEASQSEGLTSSGGGMKGAITGAIGGAGAGMSAGRGK